MNKEDEQMMKKNIVLIETLDSEGTGILYPCKFENENIRDCNYYIIFTNSHVLKEVGRAAKPEQDVNELINLQIYDDTGNRVEESAIQEIRVYNKGWNYEKQNDIAALLIAVRKQVVLAPETRIFTNTLENRSTLYMEGYPGVMLEDEVSQKIQLEGMSKSIFPESNKMGVYQITDDYHWYNGFQDKQLLSGLSGSPVYIERNNHGLLVGMNQSVSDIDRGENPFKLVYYLKMEYILNCLREASCIIFQKIDEYSYHLEWVYGKEEIINKYPNNPTFLLIGGSGAGKSSFATDFAYHGEELLATNDGQTTRTNVIYEYSIFEKNPCAIVQFMRKKEFEERMLKLKGARGILFIFRSLFGISEASCSNEYKLLEDCIEMLAHKERENTLNKMSVEDFLRDKEARKDKENLIRWYEKLLECILDTVPFPLARYVCDREWVEKCREDYQNSYEKLYCENDLENPKEFLKKYLHNSLREQRDTGDGYEETLKVMGETYILNELAEYCQDLRCSFKEYQRNCLEKGRIYIRGLESSEEKNHRDYCKKVYTEEFKKKYIENLLFCEGFFGISEFSFLKDAAEILDEIIAQAGGKLFARELRREEDEISEIVDLAVLEGMRTVYECCHEIIIDAMQMNKVGIKDNNYAITINLKEMTEGNQKLLQRCLQVANGESLTGMIHSVKIQDMVSNLYAMELKKLKISQLRIIDTHGLDHIQGMWTMEDALYDIIYSYQGKKRQLQDISVLYLKKLDSGKPDELRNLLPLVYKVIPQSPVYCVFTGIDIFYKTSEEIRNIRWERDDEKVPKAVRYILSPKGEEELQYNLYGSEERKRNMYLVLKNNLIPYCGKRELIEQNFACYKNNVKYVQKLLASIVMKEYSSLEIVDLSEFDIIKESDEFREKVEEIVKLIFKRASVNADRVHHKTLKADLRSVVEKEELGYSRSYRHRWNQLFHEAYAEVISQAGVELAECYGTAQGAVEAALGNMEERFLGESEHLWKKELEEGSEKSEFREILERMFGQTKDGKAIYENNPFDKDIEKYGFSDMKAEGRKGLYRDFFDFAKGLKSDEILKEYVDKFIKDLEVQIEVDNSAKAENVIMLNCDFVDALRELESNFTEKYDLKDGRKVINFHTMMRYYFKEKENEIKKSKLF